MRSRDTPSRLRELLARGVGAACLLVLPALLLGSCMLQPSARAVTDPTALDARAALTSVLDDTQDLLGGTWDSQDDPTPRSCAVQWGLAGDAYAALRLSSSVPDSRALESVRRVWERLGYTVAFTAVGPASQLTATKGLTDGFMVFRMSDRGMTLQGESACRPAE